MDFWGLLNSFLYLYFVMNLNLLLFVFSMFLTSVKEGSKNAVKFPKIEPNEFIFFYKLYNGFDNFTVYFILIFKY